MSNNINNTFKLQQMFFNKDVEMPSNESKVKNPQEENSLFEFGSKENKEEDFSFDKVDTSTDEYKSDAQQLTEDSVYLSDLYRDLQAGEPWAIEAAKELEVAQEPEESDNSSNAQLLRSNNELARAIKAQVEQEQQ